MTESAALFKRCMLDAAAADMNELDAEMAVPTDFSAAHARKMSGILGFRVRSYSIAKRALIVIIAAALLLTGCSVAVYFGTSRNVEVAFRPGGTVEITFSGDGVVISDGAWGIDEYMEFGYVPEGIELEYARSDKHRNSLTYIGHGKYGIIRFEQFVASKIRYSFTYYNWSDIYKIYYKDYEILVCDMGNGAKTYCWTDGVYGYFMSFLFPTERDDLAISIIEGLRPITPPNDAENGEIS